MGITKKIKIAKSNSIEIRIMLLLLLSMLIVSCEKKNELYGVTDEPWNPSLGNHRALIQVENEAQAAYLDLEWRRHDRHPENRKLIIVSQAGDTVANILRKEINNENCKLVFGPVKSGLYHFYYLPFKNQDQYGFYSKDYFPKEQAADQEWSKSLPEDVQQLQRATLIGFEARTAFDSFYPMEVIALESEKEAYLEKYPGEYHLFTEDRSLPIRMKDNVPQKWMTIDQNTAFRGWAMRNEYYVFQIGMWAQKDVDNVKIEFSPLKSGEDRIETSALTCFNTGGIDNNGQAFTKEVDLKEGQVQAFWIGIDIPEDVTAGTYEGTVHIEPSNAEARTVALKLEIDDKFLADRGDSETWRHSRLRWLNSTAGIDDQPVAPFKPIKKLGEATYDLTGKQIQVGAKGLPVSIKSYETEILSGPVSFVLESSKGEEQISDAFGFEMIKDKEGVISGSWTNTSQHIELTNVGTIESDGWINIKTTVKALKDIDLKDIRLEIPFKSEVATYMMGMGLPGQQTPHHHQAKWGGPQDSFWVGNVKGGLHCELRGASYHGPLLNLYKPAPPESWHNNGKGGFEIKKGPGTALATAYSGARSLKSGEEVEFEFSLIITPVKKLDTKSQFTNRYYHNGMDPWPKQGELDANVKIINVHHANKYNPHINYPFIAVDEMKEFVDHWHNEGMKVKTYYTIRELTNYVTEIWALRSLGTEILGNGRGGGYPWLREHFIDGYYPQWYHKVDSVRVDASVLTSSGESRWFNYYIEGLKWLVKNVDIDGLYLDDVSYDRKMLKRMRKVMDEIKPGCILDLHSNTGFSKGPAIQYTEFFPYLDKLWFGESFKYDEMPPANWLVEVSGIPFGHMGDMLHGGGNPWRGMVYGMTVRHPWVTEGVTCDPRAIWKLWDEFGIADSKMIGYWDDKPVVIPSRKDVKATAYSKNGKTLISVASWASSTVQVNLDIDWESLGLDPSKVKIKAPEIENFQPSREFAIDQSIPLEPTKGWLLVVE